MGILGGLSRWWWDARNGNAKRQTCATQQCKLNMYIQCMGSALARSSIAFYDDEHHHHSNSAVVEYPSWAFTAADCLLGNTTMTSSMQPQSHQHKLQWHFMLPAIHCSKHLKHAIICNPTIVFILPPSPSHNWNPNGYTELFMSMFCSR